MKKYLPALAIVAIMILSATLHLWDISSIGDSNAYYTAAVESMTQSWHNFFYASAEPGGSVSVDKPPLGLQIETLFALVFGVSGFSTVLPNILAGVFSVPLLYQLVKKHFGIVAGLVAALVMAVTPVVFAADRNNTQDGLLTFFLLLAAWAFIQAVESGRARWLFLGAVIVGLGFNIKMLQAYLPVPAFFALYLLGAKVGWFRKIGLTLAALAVMAAVSLSWALYVDSVPADERPYIGSSQDNSVMGLITGHNGTSRLFGGGGRNQQTPPAGSFDDAQDGPDGFAGCGNVVAVAVRVVLSGCDRVPDADQIARGIGRAARLAPVGRMVDDVRGVLQHGLGHLSLVLRSHAGTRARWSRRRWLRLFMAESGGGSSGKRMVAHARGGGHGRVPDLSGVAIWRQRSLDAAGVRAGRAGGEPALHPVVQISDSSAARGVLAAADCDAGHPTGLVRADGDRGGGCESARRVWCAGTGGAASDRERGARAGQCDAAYLGEGQLAGIFAVEHAGHEVSGGRAEFGSGRVVRARDGTTGAVHGRL
jgi:hypothetical protein